MHQHFEPYLNLNNIYLYASAFGQIPETAALAIESGKGKARDGEKPSSACTVLSHPKVRVRVRVRIRVRVRVRVPHSFGVSFYS